jgi:hypothetical protein
VMMNKSNLAECQSFPLGKLSLLFWCAHGYLLLCIVVSRWNCSVVWSQFILCYGFCWISYLNLFWLNVMVAINELWFLIMIILSNMLLYFGAILMCTFLYFFKTCFCSGYTPRSTKVTPLLECHLLLSVCVLEWLARTAGWCVLGIASVPLIQGVRIVLCFISYPVSNHNKNWKVLSWNVRGLNDSRKWSAIRNTIEESACVVLCF